VQHATINRAHSFPQAVKFQAKMRNFDIPAEICRGWKFSGN